MKKTRTGNPKIKCSCGIEVIVYKPNSERKCKCGKTVTLPKTIYVAEFSRPDYDNESIWFVAGSELQYGEQKKIALKKICEDWEIELDEVADYEIDVVGIYTIPFELVKEVYESRKQNDNK